MRAIQPCNTDLYCIVVTSWHCVLHRKLAIKILLLSTNNFCYVVAGQPTSEQSVVVLDKVDDTFRESVCDVFLIFYRSIMFVHIAAFRLQRGSSKHCCHRCFCCEEPAQQLLCEEAGAEKCPVPLYDTTGNLSGRFFQS